MGRNIKGLLSLKIGRFFARRPRGKPAPILIPDILILIFAHLSRSDLARCIAVNHLFAEVASESLYSSPTAVEFGREWRYATGKNREIIPRNIFSGVNKPLSLAPGSPLPSSSKRKPKYTAFYPSALKFKWLEHVRHLSYHSHPFEECDELAAPTPFPSLETLTVYSLSIHKILWRSSLLANLRPTHIRLAHIPNIGQSPSSFALDKEIGTKATKVTVHFLQCLPPKSSKAGDPLILTVKWPPKIRQLDLVFMVPTSSLSGNFAHGGTVSVPLWDNEIEENARAVARFMATAGMRCRCRVIGLGKSFKVAANHELFSEASQAECETTFSESLLSEYRDALVRMKMEVTKAAKMAEEVEMLTLEQYWREKGSIPL